MSTVRDLTGLTSGMLTAVERAGSDKHGDAMWRCRCSCGNESTVKGGSLRRGETKSCGCLAATLLVKDMTGLRFGKLTVIERNGSKRGRAAWHVRCDCGSESTAIGQDLRSGETRSCGCGARKGAIARHGQARHGAVTPTYVTWQAMMKRCYYPRHHNFPAYGGRGITVCDRWRHGDGARTGFECFYSDVGMKPFGLSFDRIDVNGSYEPGNVRWTTSLGQERNRRPRQKSPALAA
jgi:hypothetical protein